MPLLLLGLGLMLALALTQRSHAQPAALPAASSAALDPGMPPPLQTAVVEYLRRDVDPANLDSMAASFDARGFPITAALLRARATQLRALGRGGPKLPDPSMPTAIRTQIVNLLNTVRDPAVLEQTAATLEANGYRDTAAVLRQYAERLRSQAPAQVPPAAPYPQSPSGLPPVPPAPSGSATPLPFPSGPALSIPEGAGIPFPAPSAPASPPLPSVVPPAWSEVPPAQAPTAPAATSPQSPAPAPAPASSDAIDQIADIIAQAEQALPAILAPLGTPANQHPPATAPSVPTTPAVPTPSPAPATAPETRERVYEVKEGDNPSAIAKRFTGNPSKYTELAAANPNKKQRILDGKIYTGETLTIPAKWPPSPPAAATAPAVPSAVPAPAPGGSAPAPTGPLAAAAAQAVQAAANVAQAVAPGLAAAAAQAVPSAATPATYHIVKGDTPSGIAKKFTGDPSRFKELAQANPPKKKDILKGLIYAGDTLNLPAGWPAVPPKT